MCFEKNIFYTEKVENSFKNNRLKKHFSGYNDCRENNNGKQVNYGIKKIE